MASAFCPRNSGSCPHPTPHCIHSPASGGGRRPTPGPPDAAGGAGSGRWDPGLRLPSSPAPAAPPPSCACACAGVVRYVKCAGSGPTSSAASRCAVSGAEPFENWREVRRWRAPGVTRGSGRPRRWGGSASGGHPGGPCPEPTALVCLGGRQFPGFSSLSPNRDCTAWPGGGNNFPPQLSEGNFRPQPRWPQGPAPWA